MNLKLSFICICALFAFSATASFAWPVPDTGQTKCYDSSAEIACPQEGEAFYGQDGNHTINPASYTKLDSQGNDLSDNAASWVMVRDNVTGLIWEIKQNSDGISDYSNPHDADNEYTWFDSNIETNGGHMGTPGDGTDTEDFINALNTQQFGSYSDWRLPSRVELHSLIDYGRREPAMNTAFFPNYVNSRIWTSSTSASFNGTGAGAWSITSSGGYAKDYVKSYQFLVRAVRGKRSSLQNYLIDNGDGTVTNTTTGLMWETKTDDGGENDRDNTYSWDQAIAWIENLNVSKYLGYNDWRLPNLKELTSLLDLTRMEPAIDTFFFPNTSTHYQNYYWSSTLVQVENINTTYLRFGDAIDGTAGRANMYHARAVRGGQNQSSDHLIILSPTQGTAWTPGAYTEIIWETRSIPGNVKISLSRQGGKDGTFTEIIAESTDNNGAYTWLVSGPNSHNCVLKIVPLESGYEEKGATQGLFAIGAMSVSIPLIEFGDAFAGASCSTHEIAVANIGNQELTVNEISISGQYSTHFSLASPSCTGQTIQPSSSCAFNVDFCPTSSGGKEASLFITSGQYENSVAKVDLSGVGVEPDPANLVVLTSDSYFVTGAPGGPFLPSGIIYTLQNTGQVTLDWMATKSMQWLSLSTESGRLQPGDSTTVQVSINDYANDLTVNTYTDAIVFSNLTNGNGNTGRAVILNVIKETSTISCNFSENSGTVGTPFVVSGNIYPQPDSSAAGVDIMLVSPSGVEKHVPLLADSIGNFSTELACGIIDEAGQWTITTSWSGDTHYDGSQSSQTAYAASKTNTTITLSTQAQSIRQGDTLTISGKLTPQPFCGEILPNQNVTLKITDPQGTQTSIDIDTDQGTIESSGRFFIQDYAGFTNLTDETSYTVQATFTETDAYLGSASEIATVSVRENAGYAIIIQGKVLNEEGLSDHGRTTDYVYSVFKDRGLTADDIYYLNYAYMDPERDPLKPPIDAVPSFSVVQQAITQWARDKMDARYGDQTGQPANLFIVLVNHGAQDLFYLDSSEPTDWITSSELSGWVDTLQQSLFGGSAADQEIAIVLGFCHSGSFIDELSGTVIDNQLGTRRVIIASSDPNEKSHRGTSLDAEGNRQGEYFVSELFKEAGSGKDLKRAFETAANRTKDRYWSTQINSPQWPYFDRAKQHPLLDDDGDSKGSTKLKNNLGDGVNASRLFVGVNTEFTNPAKAQIVKIAPSRFLASNETTAYLWADIAAAGTISDIWLEVQRPDQPELAGYDGQIYFDLDRYTLSAQTSIHYEYDSDPPDLMWSDIPGFDVPGIYQIYYLTKDSQGEISPFILGVVYKNSDTNVNSPEPFDIVSPTSGELPTTVILDWQDTMDQDGDLVTYTVLIAKGDAALLNDPYKNNADLIRKELLFSSSCLVTEDDGLEDLSTYYWKVHAIDEYGLIKSSTSTGSFATNNSNVVVAMIDGYIVTQGSYNPISNASISIYGTGFTHVSDATGYYLNDFDLAPGTYDVLVTADGFSDSTQQIYLEPESELQQLNFVLTVADLIGDINGVNGVTLADAIVAMKVLSGLDVPNLIRSGYATSGVDVNNNSMVEMEEVIYILQHVAGMRAQQ